MNARQEVDPIIKFALGAGVLILMIVASQVSMPLRAILIAVAVSDIIFLLILQFGGVLPDRRKDE